MSLYLLKSIISSSQAKHFPYFHGYEVTGFIVALMDKIFYLLDTRQPHNLNTERDKNEFVNLKATKIWKNSVFSILRIKCNKYTPTVKEMDVVIAS